MDKTFVRLKTTDSQTVYVCKDAVAVLEEVPGSTRSPGHVKLYASGYKFLIDGTLSEVSAALGVQTPESSES